MVYNIEYGGGRVDRPAMRIVDADIVGVLESYDRLPEIAENTGYPYYNVGLQLLSKYPIHEPSGADGLYALIEVQPGYVVAFFNTHLDYVEYGTKLLAGRERVPRCSRPRTRCARRRSRSSLRDMEQLSADRLPGVPHRGLQPTVQPRLHRGDRRACRRVSTKRSRGRSASACSTSTSATRYREINPDPVAVPGLTWGNLSDAEHVAPARIDYVYSGGPVDDDRQPAGRRGGRAGRRT